MVMVGTPLPDYERLDHRRSSSGHCRTVLEPAQTICRRSRLIAAFTRSPIARRANCNHKEKATMSELRAARVRLQELSTEFTGVQTGLVELVNRRKQVDAQLTENENVKHEFDRLPASASHDDDDDDGDVLGDLDSSGGGKKRRTRIYKVSGPVLLEQDIGEARSTVARRLQLLGEERDRLEAEVKKTVDRAQRLQGEIGAARSEVDALVGAPGTQSGAGQATAAPGQQQGVPA